MMKCRLFVMLIALSCSVLSEYTSAADGTSGVEKRDAWGSSIKRSGSKKRGGVLTDAPLPNVDAYFPNGNKIKLRELCAQKYTVLVAGCLTCPQFHRGYPEIEAANQDYGSMGVQFFYFYKSLRHPELNGYVEAQTVSERLLQLAAAREKLGTKVPWIADTIDNQIRDGLKSASNSMFLISPEGNVIYSADHLDGQGLREALGKAVGVADQLTRASDVRLPQVSRPQKNMNVDSDTGVARPEGLVILALTPKQPDQTYYVKLRAEATPELLKTGDGRLFLGFYPDPIHGVHWNNLAKPMKYSLTVPAGVKATPAEGSAKKGPGDKDVQPRQFWVEIESASPGASLDLSMHYFGCTDTMCKPLTQDYTVQLAPSDMGSSTFGFNRGPGGAGKGQGDRRGNWQGQRRRSQNRNPRE